MHRLAALFSILLLALGTAMVMGHAYFATYEPPAARYPVRGIDISHHQGEIDWDGLAAAGVHFAYMKATEGGDFRDRRFAENWREAGRVGIARGAYHFFTLCRPGHEQAANYIAAVPRHADALPPALDLEFGGNCATRPTAAEVEAEVRAFLDPVEAHFGKPALLYATAEFYEAYLEGRLEDRPYWLRSIVLLPDFRDAGWTFWQYHNRGRRDGVDGPVDLNVFAGDRAELDALVTGSNP